MTDKPHPEFTYRASHGRLKVIVKISVGLLEWDYTEPRGQWKRTVPLSNVEPYATVQQNETERTSYRTWSILGIIVGGCLWAVNAYSFSVAGGAATILVGLAGFAYSFVHQDPVWATWKTTRKQENIMIFSGATMDEFDAAVAQIQRLILEHQKSQPLRQAPDEVSDSGDFPFF